jgi:hypothetical protein
MHCGRLPPDLAAVQPVARITALRPRRVLPVLIQKPLPHVSFYVFHRILNDLQSPSLPHFVVTPKGIRYTREFELLAPIHNPRASRFGVKPIASE